MLKMKFSCLGVYKIFLIVYEIYLGGMKYIIVKLLSF